MKKKFGGKEDFSNENYASSDWLVDRFRPNFVLEQVSSSSSTTVNLNASVMKPYDEDHWKTVTIGNFSFKSVAPCNRCSIVNVNKVKLVKEEEPLQTLSEYRKKKGKVYLGTLLCVDVSGAAAASHHQQQKEDDLIKVGEVVKVE